MRKDNIYLGALIVACMLLAYTYMNSFKHDVVLVAPSYDASPTQHWVKDGTNAAILATSMRKVVHIKLTPTVANGGSIDISALGLTTIIDKQISAQRNNTVATDIPQIAFKTVSTSAITYNIVQGSASVVTVLGLSVLQGPATIFATDLSNIEINITLTGY